MSDTEPTEPSTSISVTTVVTTVDGWIKHFRDHGATLMKAPILATILIVAAIAYYFGYAKRSDITDVMKERNDFLNDQLTAYKDRLQGATPDEAAKRFSTLENKIADQQKLLELVFPKQSRHLTDENVRLLNERIDKIKKDVNILTIFSYPVGDSEIYASEFYNFFKKNQINVIGVTPSTCSSEETGILVGMKNPDEPTPQATEFLGVLVDAKLDAHKTKWGADQLGMPDFDLFICPPHLTGLPDVSRPPPTQPETPTKK